MANIWECRKYYELEARISLLSIGIVQYCIVLVSFSVI